MLREHHKLAKFCVLAGTDLTLEDKKHEDLIHFFVDVTAAYYNADVAKYDKHVAPYVEYVCKNFIAA
eukprot:486449-Hanusia_phi.AAC.1